MIAAPALENPNGLDSTAPLAPSGDLRLPSEETEPQLAPVPSRQTHRVAVTGAAGFVGTHVCRALTEAGWAVRALVRSPGKAAARLGDLPLELKVGDMRDPVYMAEALDGVDVIVHLAAIAIERKGQSYEDINTKATLDLLKEAQKVGVTRFVHMSQNGASSSSPYRFLRSKGIAQDAVADSPLRWTILRPSVIFGPEDEFVNVLARLARLTPFIFPLPGGGTARFQPISVRDVAAAVRVALDQHSTIGKMYPIGGPAPLTLRQMAERILAAMRCRRRIVGVPVAALRPLLAVAQRVIPNPPVTTGLLDLLNVENTVPENTITTTFGVDPVPFAQEELTYLQRITAKDAIKSMMGK